MSQEERLEYFKNLNEQNKLGLLNDIEREELWMLGWIIFNDFV